MNRFETEHFYHCPYCDASISCVLDLSENAQEYIEDCEVCCCPIALRYAVEDDALTDFRGTRLDDV